MLYHPLNLENKIFNSDNLFHSNSSPILELSVKFASQICHENINKPLDGAYLADFGIDITRINGQRASNLKLDGQF